MSQKLEKLLDMLINTLEKGGDLIGEHVPKFFEEILAYEFMYSAIFSGFFGFLFLLCLLLWVVCAIKGIPDILRNEECTNSMGFLFLYSIGLFFISFVIQAHMKDVIKIKIAPRVYTLEYLRDFKAGRN
jgi:hypothetical protein